MQQTFRVVIVGADRAYLRHACAWLAGFPRIALVGITDSEPEGMLLAGEQGANVVLLDVGLLPADSDGPDLPRARYGGRPVLIMAGAGEESLALQALQGGALGCLSKETATAKELIQAVETVAQGGAVLTLRMAGLILDRLHGALPGE